MAETCTEENSPETQGVTDITMNDLLTRLQTCEEITKTKEERFDQLTTQHNEREKEFAELKSANADLQAEVNVLLSYNKKLEKKILAVDEEIQEKKKSLSEGSKEVYREISAMKTKLNDAKIFVISVGAVVIMSVVVALMYSTSGGKKEDNGVPNMKLWVEEQGSLVNQLAFRIHNMEEKLVKQDQYNLKDVLKRIKKVESDSELFDFTIKRLHHKQNTTNESTNEEVPPSGDSDVLLYEMKKKIDDLDKKLKGNENTDSGGALVTLRQNVENLEHILFAYDTIYSGLYQRLFSDPTKEFQFRWVMQNFRQHYEVGEDVFSPIFRSQLDGYCLQLYIGWRGVKNEHMGIGLKLHNCRDSTALQPFKYEYTIMILNNKGEKTTFKVNYEMISEFRRCFLVSDEAEDEDEEFSVRNCATPIAKSPFEKVVINDALFISCTVHL